MNICFCFFYLAIDDLEDRYRGEKVIENEKLILFGKWRRCFMEILKNRIIVS